MSIKEQIEKLPDFEYHGLESPDGHDIRSRDLKALADSHTRLLTCAKTRCHHCKGGYIYKEVSLKDALGALWSTDDHAGSIVEVDRITKGMDWKAFDEYMAR